MARAAGAERLYRRPRRLLRDRCPPFGGHALADELDRHGQRHLRLRHAGKERRHRLRALEHRQHLLIERWTPELRTMLRDRHRAVAVDLKRSITVPVSRSPSAPLG